MSLFKNILGAVAPIIGTAFGGPVGGAIGAVLGSAVAKPERASIVPALPPLPGVGVSQTMGSLPAVGGVVAATGRLAIAGARLAISSARYYCAKYPGWCISIGGLGVVQGMVERGELPPHRRRRGRGISSRDFRGFRRVHNILSGFCAPRMRVRRKALRG